MANGRKCFTAKWSIENFSILWESECMLYKQQHSPEFLVETLESTKWRLKLRPKRGPTMDYICLELLREVEDDGPQKIALYYELSFLSHDGSPVKSKEHTQYFRNESTSLCEVYLKKDDVLENDKDELLPQDILTVCCKMWKIGVSSPKEGRCILQTVVEVHRQTYDGVIERFSTLLPSLKMRTIYFTSMGPRISFLPFNVYASYEGIVYIQKISSTLEYSKHYALNLFMINSAGIKIHCDQKPKCKYKDDTKIPLRISLTINDLIDNKEKFLPNDVLTLQYEEVSPTGDKLEKIDYEIDVCPEIPPALPTMKKANISEPKVTSVNSSKRPVPDQKMPANVLSQASSLSTFRNDMKTMYHDHLFSDIVLRADTEEFPAHRSVLSARSPVFRSMFSTDMREKTDKYVEISDLSSDTVRRMLLFLYVDFVEELDLKSAKELYFAADKYDIASLKHRCSVSMQQSLCPTNVCEVLVLADMHQDRDLKSAVCDYIQKNDKKVFASDEWKLFMETNSYLAAHVMHTRCMKN